MKSIEFLESKLNDLYKKFSDIKIRYEYRANTVSHLIEVIPLSFFEGNEEYMACEFSIEEEFENRFPNENIVFISEDSLSEITTPNLKIGYDTIKFTNEVTNFDIIIKGFCDNIDSNYSNNYALAA